MVQNDEGKEREVQFNLGSSQLELIGSLLEKASFMYLKGDTSGWFFALKSIKLQIISRLTEGERNYLAGYERLTIMCFRALATTREETYQGKITNCIETYETKIKELLETKGFLIPLKESKTSAFGKKSAGER